jgi:hypothetical protein
MTKQKKLRGLNGTLNEGSLTHQQLLDALYYLEDMMDRTGIPFFLLEGAAKQVKDDAPYLSLNQIDAGIEEKNLQETGIKTMKMVFPSLEIDQNTISFTHSGVPVVIWIIHKQWKFFQNPDGVFYSTCNFQIPNPFDRYWKSRFLIK